MLISPLASVMVLQSRPLKSTMSSLPAAWATVRSVVRPPSSLQLATGSDAARASGATAGEPSNEPSETASGSNRDGRMSFVCISHSATLWMHS
jgi:hypothetical protein